jgi:hypothetical protein
VGTLRAAVRQSWPYALISGVTALVAFLALPPQSLPHKYHDGDVNLLIPYGVRSVLAAGFAILVVLLTWGRRGGRAAHWRHLAVPPVLVVLIPVGLAVCGGARSRWGTGLLCAAVAVLVHVSLGLPRRRTRVVVLGLIGGVAAVIAVSMQTPWRAEDFRATGLPLVVADVPGYELTGTYADVGVIFLAYEDTGGARRQLDATIGRGGCRAEQFCVALDGGYTLALDHPYLIGNYGVRDAVPTGITVRPVSARYLASFPVGNVSLPD